MTRKAAGRSLVETACQSSPTVRSASALPVLTAHSQLVAICILLLGASVRLAHLGLVGGALPFRYGALFVEFSEQIVANGYSLPRQIPYYTDGGIPFAYPPLPFYVEGLLLDVFALPKFSVATLLPAFVAVLSVPSFYLMARQFVLSIDGRLAALLAFATMPAAFAEQIEGAGLAEAFGTLAIIWLAISLIRASRCRTVAAHALSGLFCALCICASPGSAYASIPTVLILALIPIADTKWQPNVRTVLLASLTIATAAAASSVYWQPVTANHGISVLFDSFIGQHGPPMPLLLSTTARLASFRVSQAPFPLIWDALILTGLVSAILRRDWAVPVWFLVLFVVPREGDWLAAVPSAILAGSGAASVLAVLPGHVLRRSAWSPEQLVVSAGAVVLLATYVVLNPAIRIRQLVSADEGLSWEAISAMQWANQNIPERSKLVVLSRPQVVEWVPQIARRTVLNSVFGSEWQPRERAQILEFDRRLEDCTHIGCVRAQVAETLGYEGFYLLVDGERLSHLTSDSSVEDQVFDVVWHNDEIAIVCVPGADEGCDGS